MSTGLPRPGLARSAHRGRIKFLRGYVSISSAAVNRPTHAASLSEVARTSMRSVFRGPAHQLAVRMRINNCTHGHYGPSNQPCTSNCTSAEGLHFSAFHSSCTYTPHLSCAVTAAMCGAGRYIMDDVMRQWEHYDTNKDNYVTWEEFRDATFGESPGQSTV